MRLLPTLLLCSCLSSVDEHEAFRNELRDQDQDGFWSSQSGGSDCDDGDPRVYPGAPDKPYDGLDADCGNDDDYDADMDGHRPIEYGGGDCDDSRSEVHPGAIEVCQDGLDNDCDGQLGQCGYAGELLSTDATLAWEGRGGERLGEMVLADGDRLAWTTGQVDEGIRVEWVEGVADWLLVGDELRMGFYEDDLSLQTSQIGHAEIATGDFQGDGSRSLVLGLETSGGLGIPDTHGVFLLDLESSGGISQGLVFQSEYPVDYLSPVAVEGGSAGHGLFVGACGAQRVWRVSASLSSGALGATQEIQFEGGPVGLGCTVADGGDMDGDGIHELVVGDGQHQIWLVWGALLSDSVSLQNVEDLALPLHADTSNGEFGSTLQALGDLDDDGLGELAVGSPCGGLGECQGGIAVFGGDGVMRFQIADDAWGFGSLLAGGFDATGDGVPDFVAGTRGLQAFLFSGQHYAGTLTADAAFGTLSSPGLGAVGFSPDLDGDGLAEMLVGIPGAPGAESPGEVFLFMAAGF